MANRDCTAKMIEYLRFLFLYYESARVGLQIHYYYKCSTLTQQPVTALKNQQISLTTADETVLKCTEMCILECMENMENFFPEFFDLKISINQIFLERSFKGSFWTMCKLHYFMYLYFVSQFLDESSNLRAGCNP